MKKLHNILSRFLLYEYIPGDLLNFSSQKSNENTPAIEVLLISRPFAVSFQRLVILRNFPQRLGRFLAASLCYVQL